MEIYETEEEQLEAFKRRGDNGNDHENERGGQCIQNDRIPQELQKDLKTRL